MMHHISGLRPGLSLVAVALALASAAPARADALGDGFADPPQSARPRVWWHWMNGNVTIDGIAKDMAWMKRIGIGGLQNFDADLQTPQIVPKRLAYMTPEWKEAFRFAAAEAERQGLELAIAASPGWSETGGPWVKPEDGLKKLVWSETILPGGKRFTGKIAAPPGNTGPFQSAPRGLSIEEMLGGGKPRPTPQAYGEVAVLAVPAAAPAIARPSSVLASGQPVDPAGLLDADFATGVAVPKGTADQPGTLHLAFATPQTVRSVVVSIPDATQMFVGPLVLPELQASDDGTAWRKVADVTPAAAQTTVSFAAVTARHFRLVFRPVDAAAAMSNMDAAAPGSEVPGFMAAMAAGNNRPWQVKQFVLSPEPRVDQAEAKAGFSIPNDYYALGDPGDGAKGALPATVIDLTSRMKPDGTLDWTPPRGTWRVLRFGHSLIGTTNHPAPPEATGLEVDKFDGDAVRRYLDHYLGMYRDAAGAEMLGGKGVRAILTDSIEVGAANWTPKLIDQFRKLRGYDPLPWLPALTGTLVGSRAESDRFLFDFRRTLADLMASEHYGTVAKVAHDNGLKVYGEALEDNRPSLGDDMAMRSHADVPMAAMWSFDRASGAKPSYLADIKGAASVAHLYGQNLVAAESMTSARQPWSQSPRDLKHIIDLEFVTGVNRPVVHTSVHQPVDDKVPGLSLLIFGQYFNRHESWAEMAKPWVDYLARTGYMLQQGRNVADVGYFYGEEAPLTGLYGRKPVADAPVANAFDFVNADALLNLLSNDGSDVVAPSSARYRAIYLGGSSRRMSLPVLRKLAALAEGGATIVGMAPEANPGLAGDAGEYAALVAKLWPGSGDARIGKGRVIASQNIAAALTASGVRPDFAYAKPQADSELLFVHRKLDDGEVYFVNNRRNRAEKVEARFRVTGKAPELWRAMDGTAQPLTYRIENGETVVPLDLGPEDAVFVVFRKAAAAPTATVAAPMVAGTQPLTAPWTVAFQPGRGAPAGITLPALASLSEQADPGVKYFSGTATYTTRFTLPKGVKPGQPLLIDLGHVGDVAEVRVNGQLAGTAWFAPDRVDIGRLVKPGSNALDVRVANLWVNRLIGDKQPGTQKITFTAAPTYNPDAPLRPSGLIGPVKLMWLDRTAAKEPKR